jgi:hypothetical protein
MSECCSGCCQCKISPMYNFVQCRQRTVSPVFRVVKSQENLISRGALDPNHHGTRLRLRGLVARSGRGKPAFKVSTEPTRVHKDHFVERGLDADNNEVFATAGRSQPTVPSCPAEGMVTVHWDDEIYDQRPCMPCSPKGGLLTRSGSPLQIHARLHVEPTQFKRQTKHKTGGLHVKRHRRLHGLHRVRRPHFGREKDDVRGRPYTLQNK